MNTKTLAIIAVAVVAVVAVACVALFMGGDDESDGRVEYDYKFDVQEYTLLGEKVKYLDMDLVIKNDNYVSASGKNGLQCDFITVKVTTSNGEYTKDGILYGSLSPGNETTSDLSWIVPLDFSLDQIENVEIGWNVPEGTEETFGDVPTPNFVRNESLSTDETL